MKNCKKCNKAIEKSKEIDGVIYPGRTRSYCWDCSPLRNRKHHLDRIKDGMYTCSGCNISLPHDDVHFHRNHTDNRLYSRCKKCCSIKSRNKWMLLKSALVESLGGKCILCGYHNYVGALHFHHKDPSEKEFNIALIPMSTKSYNLDVLKKEVSKCILVCGNCHNEIHAGMHPDYILEKPWDKW